MLDELLLPPLAQVLRGGLVDGRGNRLVDGHRRVWTSASTSMMDINERGRRRPRKMMASEALRRGRRRGSAGGAARRGGGGERLRARRCA
jgi:hypothetical protein